MRRLLVCALLVSACGDVVEEPKPLGPPPTLTVTIGEKVCHRELRGECCEGTLIFQVNARIEASAPLRDFSCRGRSNKGDLVTCSGPPSNLTEPWEGIISCDFGDWNRDGDSGLYCYGTSTEDGQGDSDENWDELFELRKCDVATDI